MNALPAAGPSPRLDACCDRAQKWTAAGLRSPAPCLPLPLITPQAALLERLEEPGGLPEEEAVAALRQLGDLGEWAAAPALAAALHEGEPVAAAAEEACWQLFLRCARRAAGGRAAGGGLQGHSCASAAGAPRQTATPCPPHRCPAARCPTEELQQMMSEGVVLMRRPEQWDAAAALFDDMVRRAPTFAEARGAVGRAGCRLGHERASEGEERVGGCIAAVGRASPFCPHARPPDASTRARTIPARRRTTSAPRWPTCSSGTTTPSRTAKPHWP